MRELLIVFSEGCPGSQQLKNVMEALDCRALGLTVTWIPFDPRDPRVRSAGVFATPAALLEGHVLFMGALDHATLLRKLGTRA